MEIKKDKKFSAENLRRFTLMFVLLLLVVLFSILSPFFLQNLCRCNDVDHYFG